MFRTTTVLIAALCLSAAACAPPQQTAEAPATTAETADPTVAAITTPTSGAQTTTPLIVDGTAPGDWFFEAQFPVQLVAADGTVLAEAPAMAQGETVTEAPVPYHAELVFIVTEETPATLVLQEDMPADNTDPREISIPVVLLPR